MTLINPEEETESAREERHRVAERRHWTFEKVGGFFALLFTAIAGGGAIASAIASFGAWNAATKAVTEANRQAIAAEAQIAIAKDTEGRQLRAYLYVRRYPIVADQTSATVKIEVHAAGTTPAYKIKIDTQMSVVQYLVGQLNLPDITSQNVSPVERTEQSALYGIDFIPIDVSMPKYSQEAMRAVWAKDPLIGDNRFLVHGVVRYLDVFGAFGEKDLQPERRYEFCFIYHPERDPTGSERGCEKYNKPG
jgi:hypothetical protein